jgi:hypothetical protein
MLVSGADHSESDLWNRIVEQKSGTPNHGWLDYIDGLTLDELACSHGDDHSERVHGVTNQWMVSFYDLTNSC